jgi:16S rRNA (guanine(1405)-N(7))-methyltransferase
LLPFSDEVDSIVNEILTSSKYRSNTISEETIHDVVVREYASGKKRKEIVKNSKRKLHNIVASYLGDVDYQDAYQRLNDAFKSGEQDAIRNVCESIMTQHASTKERLPYLDILYKTLFDKCGKPARILDLACGLHPFAFPWMGLPVTTQYFAYDVNKPRISLINHFLSLSSLSPLAQAEDILVNTPPQEADIAFIFKEVHRFEQRRQGSSRELINQLNTRTVAISLPVESLRNRNNLLESYKRLFMKNILQDGWEIEEVQIGNEFFFCIRKG